MAVVILTALGFACPAGADDSGGPPPIFVGGRAVHEPAIVERGRLLVPVRGIFETLHADVGYTPPRIVVVRKNESVVAGLLVGSRHAVVQNRPHLLAVAPLRRGGRVYVPLRVIAEIVGATVAYESRPRLVDIHVPAQELADAPPKDAPPGPPPQAAPPLWAIALVGFLLLVFAAECVRRLIVGAAPPRPRVSR